MSTALDVLQQARRQERSTRAFSGVTRPKADRMVASFKQMQQAGDFNSVVFVGKWTPDGRISIAHTHPIRIRESDLAKAYAEPSLDDELPTMTVPISIGSDDLFRACRSFGTKLEKARKKAAA